MRNRKKRFPGVALLGVGVGVCLGCALEPMDAGLLPRESVEVLVDNNGVPHVYAKSDSDAFFGAV
jgi:acyl-homoserine lactone acylase PvdQ